MKKSISDIGPVEMRRHPVWVFPMDEDQYDDQAVIPAESTSDLEDHQVIVRCVFRTRSEQEYIGYIYWGSPCSVEHTKPCMFLDETGRTGISFWNGIVVPSEEDIQVMRHLGHRSFPIEYRSEPTLGLKEITGLLEGIYYIEDGGSIQCKKP